MNELSDGASRVLAQAKRLNRLKEGDRLDAISIHPLFGKLKQAKAAAAELVEAGMATMTGNGALELTAKGIAAARGLSIAGFDSQ